MRGLIVLSLVVLGAALELKRHAHEIEDTNYALTNGQPIFYQIVMGTFPNRMQYKLWLSALRGVGKYAGTVLIVTDKPGCIVNGLGKELLGGEMIYTDENVDIFPGTGEGKEGQIHILKVKTPKSVLGIKMHKSKAWANVKKANIEHPVSSIIYTDTDVIVGQNINQWLALEKSLEKKGHTLALFPDIGQLQDNTQNLHTGVVVMFPTEASQNCIHAWGVQLGGGSDDPAAIHHFSKENSLLETEKTMGVDQLALLRADQCKAGKGVHLMNAQYLSLPNQRMLKSGKTTLFMHITNTGQWKNIGDEVKEKFFYNKLGLSKDVNFLARGTCSRDLWDTDAYRKMNPHMKKTDM